MINTNPLVVHTIALTGANGRLGRHLMSALNSIGVLAVPIPRDVLGSSNEMAKYLEKTHPIAVVNSAAISQGPSCIMKKVNTHMAVSLGKVANQVGLPFFHMSTTATAIPGISEEKTPYAWTKSIAKNEIVKLNKATIIELDTLIGNNQSDQIDISTLAGGGLPLAVKMLGGRHIIQPTSYQAVSKAVANLLKDYMKGQPVPSSLSAVGDPIALADFIDLTKTSNSLFKKYGLELQINPNDLHALANVVQNGSLSPEFLHLGEMASKKPQVHDNENFEFYHDEPLPTHEELAKQVNQTTVLNICKTAVNIFKNSPQKLQLISEAIDVWGKSRLKKSVPTLQGYN